MSGSSKKPMRNVDQGRKEQTVKADVEHKSGNPVTSGQKKQNSNRGYKEQSNRKAQYAKQQSFNYYLLPFLFVLSFLPLIMNEKSFDPKLKQFVWSDNKEKVYDLFLYYKLWLLVAAALIMVVILVVYAWRHKYNKPLHFSIGLIPLGVYGLLALLSAVFSSYPYFSLRGSMDQFESVFALLGYCILVFYAFQFVKTEADVKVLIQFLLISVLILSALGLTQFIGKDFFGSELGSRLITGGKAGKGGLQFNFGLHRVYLTLYNPNYVGVYAALVAPIFLVLMLFSKRLKPALLNLAALIGLMICVMGAQSLAGIISIFAAIIGVVIVMWRYLLKRIYITVTVAVALMLTLVLIDNLTDHYMLNRVRSFLSFEKAEAPNITSIITDPEKVSITYKGNVINFALVTDQDNTIFLHLVTDGDGKEIAYAYNENNGYYDVLDSRFEEISFSEVFFEDTLGTGVRIDGKNWVFSNQVGDGTYHILNRFLKWDKLYQQPENILNGYEGIASGRGYLWSRTLPLLKKYMFLGSGPDTYTMAFPQNDYLGFYNHGYEALFITKPHSLYLQIAVQTGVLSLIAFLLFYGYYIITSLRLYLKGRFSSYYAQVGVAIMIGTFAYMIAGLTNDSSITTAPVFWCLMGLGLVVNEKAKPLIMEEDARIKEEKELRGKQRQEDDVVVENHS